MDESHDSSVGGGTEGQQSSSKKGKRKSAGQQSASLPLAPQVGASAPSKVQKKGAEKGGAAAGTMSQPGFNENASADAGATRLSSK